MTETPTKPEQTRPHQPHSVDSAPHVYRLTGRLRSGWERDGARGFSLGVTGALLVTFFAALRLTTAGAIALDRVSSLRPDLAWGQWLLRLPLSTFAPALRLPVWGAVAQVLVVGTVAGLLIGRRRALTVTAVSHVVASLVGRFVVVHPHLLGGWLPTTPPSLRDTGPSAAVASLAIAAAVASDLPAVATGISAILVIEAFATPTLAGVEHVAAVVVGLIVGWWWHRSQRHGSPAEVVEPAGPRGNEVRRRLATIVAIAGLINMFFATAGSTTPLMVHRVLRVVPFTVGLRNRGFALVAGVMLLIAARGLRRGQQVAWAMIIALSATRLLAPIRSTSAVVEATLTIVLVVALIVERRSFGAPGRRRTGRQTASVIASGVFAVAGVAALVAKALARRGGHDPYGHVVLAVVERLAGRDSIVLPAAIDNRLEPWLGLIGALLVGTALWLLTRPARSQPTTDPALRVHARDIVRRYGTDTLAWFALRDDKTMFVHGDTLIAYSVKGSTALVSPDPIGPAHERTLAWHAFVSFAHDHGWSTVVLAASPDWLPHYLSNDMHAIYIGDEAVVDVGSFSLVGGKKKSLRQAATRVARNGYHVTFHDPSQLDPDLAAQLRRLSTLSRRGDTERGYSMTLGRFFDPNDVGMLIAVCHNNTGQPVAFCTFVPAPGIGGWSLDAMRRDDGEHPNGLLDFIIIETISHLRNAGHTGLCLNFATMRSVLANETETGLSNKILKWSLRKGSETMQIESLWRYNAKFNPQWSARYAVYETLSDVPDALIAVARAESLWELPVIGRLLSRSSKPPTPTGPAEPRARGHFR